MRGPQERAALEVVGRKTTVREGKSDIGNEGGGKSSMLSFDEPTLDKAKRKQWGSKPQVRS